MNDSLFRIICRVVKRRVEEGEMFDQIILEYPRLTEDDQSKIKSEVEKWL
ncbi:hypothetical protein ACVS9P_03695 [Caproicibacterium sp. NSD3]